MKKNLLQINLLIMLIAFGMQIIAGQTVVPPTPQDARLIQTPQDADKVCVEKAFIEDSNKCFDEVIALRATVAQFLEKERTATERERVNAANLLASLDTLIKVKDMTISQYEKMVVFLQQMNDFKDKIIERLMEMQNKPKSAFQRFLKGALEVIKAAVFIVVGKSLAGI